MHFNPKSANIIKAKKISGPMNETDDLSKRLARIKSEHRKVDEEITLLSSSPAGDQIHLQRLKKKKLSLRDEISKIEASMVPDIIA